MGGEGGGRDEESSSSAVAAAAASAFGGGGEIASAVVDLGYDRDEREGRRIDEAKSSSTVVASTTTAGRRKRATSSLRAAEKKVSAKRRRRTKKKGGVWKEILLPHAPSLDDGWRRRPIRGGDVDMPRSSVVRAQTGDTTDVRFTCPYRNRSRFLGMSGVDRSSSDRLKRSIGINSHGAKRNCNLFSISFSRGYLFIICRPHFGFR